MRRIRFSGTFVCLCLLSGRAALAGGVDWDAAAAKLRAFVDTGQFKQADTFANVLLADHLDEKTAARTRFDLLRVRLLMYTRYGEDTAEALAEAKTVADAAADPRLSADLAAARAKFDATRRDNDAALAGYGRALAGYETLHAEEAAADTLAAALTLAAERVPAGAAEWSTRVRAFLADHPTTPAGPKLRIALAAATTNPGSALRQWLDIAAESAARHDAANVAVAWSRVATLYETAGQPADALVAARRGLFAAQQGDASDTQFRLDWQLARLQHGKGDDDAAIDSYLRAVRSLQTIRHDELVYLSKSGAAETFRQGIGPIYYQLADLLIRRSASRAHADDVQGDLRLARQAVEQLKTGELEDYFLDPCGSVVKQQQQIVDRDLQNAALVYFIPLADRTEILLTTPSGRMTRVTSPVTAAALSTAARKFRYDVTNRRNAAYRTSGKQLYDWLVAPIRPVLESQTDGPIDTLVFLPDGDLRTIPMAALYDGQHFLIEKYSVAVSPGLTLMRPEPLSRDNKQVRVIEVGITGERTVGKITFGALPNVASELDRINDLFPGTLLKDKDFKSGRFKESLAESPFTIVHIASHGQFKADARDTFVLTFDDVLGVDALEQLMLPSKYRDRPIELLTLSACQTATGDDGARAALGMAGIAVKAGARSAMATLWFVSDEASGDLVAHFYTSLRDNAQISRAQALRQAQLGLLKSDRFRHPYYWAPFLMIGNWK